MRKSWWAWAGASGVWMVAGCGPTGPVPPAPDPNVALFPNDPAFKQGEISSAIIPPNTNLYCNAGRTFVAFGDGWSENMVASTDNTCLSSPGCFTDVGPPALPGGTYTITTDNTIYTDPTVPCDHTISPQTVAKYSYFFTDMNISRTSVHLGTINDGLPALIHLALQPAHHAPPTAQPIPGQPGQYACNLPFDTTSLFVDISQDCGATWKPIQAFDINGGFAGGVYAVPMDAANAAGYGFDRKELYVDPFLEVGGNSHVYISTSLQLPPSHQTMLLRSKDGGQNWDPPMIYSSGSSNSGENGAPTVMTSTEDGRLFAFTCYENQLGADTALQQRRSVNSGDPSS